MNHYTISKSGAAAVLSVLGGALAAALGGWDVMLRALVACMAADFVTGVAAAALGRSDKSRSGRISSAAALEGLMKKGFELLVILVASALEQVTGTDFIRSAVICFFIGTEGISVLENGGLLGIPLPPALRRWFEALRRQGENGEEDGHDPRD